MQLYPKQALFLIVVCVVIFGVFTPHTAFACDLAISWNPNTEPDLAGYKIYYGTSPRSRACPPGGLPKCC